MIARRLGPLVTLVFVASLLFLTALPVAGHHAPRIDDRIVEPWGVRVSQHVPVVAGYEPFPFPQPCLAAGAPVGPAIFAESFDDGGNDFAFVDTTLATGTTALGRNLWSVTTFAGEGEIGDQGARLYFGQVDGPRPGTMLVGESSRHVAGAAAGPWFDLPATGAVLVFADKWEVENLAGYDHLFVEMETQAGAVHLLCSANALGRADPAGVNGSSIVASCSPYLFGPCPNAALDTKLAGEQAGPLWETRWVNVPSSLAGQLVRVRFTFDSSDPAANFHMGWMVDDVRVLTRA